MTPARGLSVHFNTTRKLSTWFASMSLCVTLLPGCGSGSTSTPPMDQALAARIAPVMTGIMRQYAIPGAGIAVAYQGRLVYESGYGSSDIAAGTAVMPDTSFRVASISKAVTGMTILRLFEPELPGALQYKVFGPAGLLPDAAFPDFAGPLDARVMDITLGDLLEHTSGWQIDGYDPQFDLVAVARAMGVSAPAPARTVISYMLKRRTLGAAPGTRVQYSNFGYNVLGRVIEHKTGKPYAQAVQETVLRRAGAGGMFIAGSGAADRAPGESVYYDYAQTELASAQDGSGRLGPAAYYSFDFNTMDAHGGWAATPGDLVRFALSVTGTTDLPPLLKPQTVALMSSRNPSFPSSPYRLGWDLFTRNGVRTLERGGALTTSTYAFLQIRDDGWTWATIFNRMPVSSPSDIILEDAAKDFSKIQDDLAAAISGTAASVQSIATK